MANAKSTEVVKPGSGYSDDELLNVKTFADALELVRGNVGEANVLLADQVLGNGFRVLDNKDKLLEVPMLVVSWDFHSGDYGEFATVHLVTEQDEKYIINDGSSGICKQLRDLTSKKNIYGGLMVRKGLRRSDFTYDNPETGKQEPAKTYYFDVSA